MHSTSFTIFGQRAASSSLAPAMSVHISHSTPHPFSSILPPPLAYAAVVTHAQRQFRFQFRMLSMRRQRQKKKGKETQHKRKTSKSCCQSLNNVSFCCRCTWTASDSDPTDPQSPLPTLSFFPFLFFACAAYVP